MYEFIARRVKRCAAFLACAVLTSSVASAQVPVGQPSPVPPLPAQNDPQQIRQELDKLRQEFEAIRDAYGQRLAALESRLAAMGATVPLATPAQPATGQPPTIPPPETTQVQVPAGAAGSGGPQGTLPVYGNPSALSKIFNPDIAVIGNFLGASGKNDINPAPSFEMNEAEMSFQAVVDPFARADFFLSAEPEGLDMEEAFVTFTSLPAGLLMKVGKMKQAFGKSNALHEHQLSWTDRPLVNLNFLSPDEGLSDSGISVSRLILNPWFFLEATGEVYRGDSDAFASHDRSQLSYLGRLRGYRDLTENTNVDIGTSFAWGHNQFGPDFTTRLVGVDATLRYRPLRRAIYNRVLARTELMWHRGEHPDGVANSFGMYASADYQFSRRWFAGARLDYSARGFDSSLKDKGGAALLTFWPSEFSQIRGQYRRLRYAEGHTSNELLFQFLFSIGAHGAHVF